MAIRLDLTWFCRFGTPVQSNFYLAQWSSNVFSFRNLIKSSPFIIVQYSCLLFLGLCFFYPSAAMAIEPQHQVAESYGGTRVYAGDSAVISPLAATNPYPATATGPTGPSTDPTNVTHKDSLDLLRKSTRFWRSEAVV